MSLNKWVPKYLDEETKNIILSTKFNVKELEAIKREIEIQKIKNFEMIEIIVNWAQIWKYLKNNIVVFKNKNILTCSLKLILITNLFGSLINELTNNQAINIEFLFYQYKDTVCHA